VELYSVHSRSAFLDPLGVLDFIVLVETRLCAKWCLVVLTFDPCEEAVSLLAVFLGKDWLEWPEWVD